MRGKNKCKILKQIRQRIADENDIPYVTRECSYQEECRGTCPRCEAELRYLERELEKRRALGKAVAVAAVAAGLSLSLTACVGQKETIREELGGEAVLNPGDTAPETKQAQPDPDRLVGEVAVTVPEIIKGLIPQETLPEHTKGYIAVCTEPAASTEPETSEPEIFELEGDVAWIPEHTEIEGELMPLESENEDLPEATESDFSGQAPETSGPQAPEVP